MSQAEYDVQALTGAAEFFENLATGENSAPLAFAQAIRRAIPHVEMEAWVDAEMNRNMTPEEAAEQERGAESIRLRIQAALAVDPQPVAWRYRWPDLNGHLSEWTFTESEYDARTMAHDDGEVHPLYASPAHLQGGVGVKPLEWEYRPNEPNKFFARWLASSILGEYRITDMTDNGDGFQWYCSHFGDAHYPKTLEEAKAAAQADFEQRIRSALVSPSSSGEQP